MPTDDEMYGKVVGGRMKEGFKNLLTKICNRLDWSQTHTLKSGILAIPTLYKIRRRYNVHARAIQSHLIAIEDLINESISTMHNPEGSRKTLCDFVEREFLKPEIVEQKTTL